MWSTAVSTTFSPLIQSLEVCLRNAMDDALSPHYGPYWFEHWVTQEANDKRARGSLPGRSEGERLIAKAKDKVWQRDAADARRRGSSLPATYIPGAQGVLAELTFGFWVRFLARWYWDVNKRKKLWPNHVTTVFPGAPSAMRAVGQLHPAFEEAVDMRNRIHHQEPLWKDRRVTSIDGAIAHLSMQLTKSLEKVDYLCPSQKSVLQKFGVISAIEEVCSKETFFRFTGTSAGKTMELNAAKRSLRLLEKNTQSHQALWVTSAGKRPQLIVRNATRRFF